jgi:hypothetical protein
MKMFFVLLFLLCSVIFANPVSEITLMSGSEGHVIQIRAALPDAKLSYQSKDGDLLVKINSQSLRRQPALSTVKRFNDPSVATTMAARVEDGTVQILLKDFRLSPQNIRLRQREDVVLLFLNPNATASVQEVTALDKAPITLQVIKNSVNLRRLPSMDAEVIGRAVMDERLFATSKNGQWYAVRNQNGVPCWVHESVVHSSTQSVSESPQQLNLPVTVSVQDTPPSAPRINNGTPGDELIVVIDEYIITTEDTTTMRPLALVMDTTPAVETPQVPEETVATKVYSYSRRGRDPFLPLDRSDFIRQGLPNINNITLVGILYDSNAAFALFEERVGNEITSFSMKIGDPVVSGKLLRIEASKVVFLMRESTFSYTVEKELNVN